MPYKDDRWRCAEVRSARPLDLPPSFCCLSLHYASYFMCKHSIQLISLHARAGTMGDLDYNALAIDGSALLDLRDLRVLGVVGWPIYLMRRRAPSGGSTDAELALTELHASTLWRKDHEMLLHAALRGGERACRAQACCRSQGAFLLSDTQRACKLHSSPCDCEVGYVYRAALQRHT